MKISTTSLFTCVGLLFVCACATPNSMQSSDSFSADGELRRVGNDPFSRLVLTTTDRNSYVLVFEDGAAPSADTGHYHVTGRLYAADWNGMRQAHIDVATANQVE